MVIPSEMRRALCLSEGATLIATVEDGRLVLEDAGAAAKRWRGSWKALVAAPASLVDELLEARGAEAALDDAEAAGDAGGIHDGHQAIARAGGRG